MAFVAVAKHGAFIEASRHLDLSPSATSKAVTRLEDHLGVKLLQRTTRSVSLTQEGERYLTGAAKLIEQFRDLGEEVTGSISTPRGRLTVSAPSAFGRLWLITALPKFLEDWPEITIDLHLDDKAAQLAGDGIDVAIRAGQLPDGSRLMAKKLFADSYHICATPEYWDINGRPAVPDDLSGHNCLNFRVSQTGNYYPWKFINDAGEVYTHSYEGRVSIDDGESVFKAACAGLGVSQIPGFMAAGAIENGRLEEVLVDFRPPASAFHALYMERRLLAPRIRVFIDFLVKTLDEELL